MLLTLDDVSKNPQAYRYTLETAKGERLLLRPLESIDEAKLANLIENLSAETKKLYSYDKPADQIAKEHCDAINKYDKLRFVLEKEKAKELIGLFEFSFGIPQSDVERFEKYGIKLSSKTDCRIGPLLRDDYQSQGVGSSVMPIIIELVKLFGKSRIILWGGVFKDNPRAIHFYEKNGFKSLGQFENQDGAKCFDMMLSLN